MLMAPPPQYSPTAIKHQSVGPLSSPGMQGQAVLQPGFQSAIHGLPQLNPMNGGQALGQMPNQGLGMSKAMMTPHSDNPMAPEAMSHALGGY